MTTVAQGLMDAKRITHPPKWEVVAAFCFGITFVVAILTIAIAVPTPTPFEYTVFRIVISLAAAGVGAILPGFIMVRYKDLVRAGGALALFLVVYFGAPVAVTPVQEGHVIEPAVSAEPVISHWLAGLDAQDYASAYQGFSDRFKSKFTEEQFRQICKKSLGTVGPVVSRELIGTQSFLSPPGAPTGAYQQFMYETKYRDEARKVLMSVIVVGEGSGWKLYGFQLGVRNAQGIVVPFEPGVQ